MKLQLKVRKRGDSFRLSLKQIRQWLELPDEIAKQSMHNYLLPLKKTEPVIHDFVFIQQVVNWIPMDDRTGVALGLPLKTQVRLINLTNQLMPFDDAKDPQPGLIELSTKDIDLLWERMNDDKFLVGAITPSYGAFLMDFQAATKKKFKFFEDEEKESGKISEVEIEEEQAEAEEAKGKDNEREPERVEVSTEG